MNRDDYLRQVERCEAEARRQTGATMRRQLEALASQMRDFADKMQRVEQSRPRLQAK